MPYTILNEVDAAEPDQAEPDSVDFVIITDAFARNGVISGCAVTAQSPASMTLDVASGTVEIAGVTGSISSTTAVIGAATASPRFDLVVAGLGDVVAVVAGTPSSNPVFPAIPASRTVLAAVHVPAAVTEIGSTRIVDKRVVLETAAVLADGSRALTADWDAGAHNIIADGFHVNDNETVGFGNAVGTPDATLQWDGSNLLLDPDTSAVEGASFHILGNVSLQNNISGGITRIIDGGVGGSSPGLILVPADNTVITDATEDKVNTSALNLMDRTLSVAAGAKVIEWTTATSEMKLFTNIIFDTDSVALIRDKDGVTAIKLEALAARTTFSHALQVLEGNVRIGSNVDPTVALDVTGAALISTSLGVNATPSAAQRASIGGFRATGNTNQQILVVGLATTLTENATNRFRSGFDFAGTIDLAEFDLKQVYGVRSFPTVSINDDGLEGGVLAELAPFIGRLTVSGSDFGNTGVTDAAVFKAEAEAVSTIPITTARAFWARDQGDTNVTLAIGLDIEDQTGATTNLAIRVLGTTHHSIHQPAITIGGTGAPQSGFALDVQGDMMVADTFGLVIGHTAQIVGMFNATTELQVLGADGPDASMILGRFSADANGPAIQFLKGRDAIGVFTTTPSAGDRMGGVYWGAVDATDNDFINAASIVAEIDGAPGNNDMPGRIMFSTTADGAASPTERMRITSSGNVGIGTISPDALFQVAGDVLLNGKVGIGGTNPTAKLHVDQTSATAAIPVALFDQADVSEEMFEFVTTIGTGNAIEAIGAKTLTTTHFIKVTVPGGLTRYFPVGTIA